MTTSGDRDNGPRDIGRRGFLRHSAGAGLLAAGLARQSAAAPPPNTAIDSAAWSPEYVRNIAGTLSVDTAAECAKVVPLTHAGRLTYWYVGPNEASPQLDHVIDAQFWAAFAKTYPNITVEKQSFTYDQILDKLRTAALGNRSEEHTSELQSRP